MGNVRRVKKRILQAALTKHEYQQVVKAHPLSEFTLNITRSKKEAS